MSDLVLAEEIRFGALSVLRVSTWEERQIWYESFLLSELTRHFLRFVEEFLLFVEDGWTYKCKSVRKF